MFSKSSWLHLRIPFSYFLLPVFIFSLSLSPNLDRLSFLCIFFILHFLVYPASNGYNSYFDKDVESIGGLKNPPPVEKGLFWLSLLLDAVAIILALWVSGISFAFMILVYGLASKAYSHPSIRLKRMPFIGWLVAGVFQGFFTLWMCVVGLSGLDSISVLTPRVIFAGTLCTLMLWGNYPMTQVYQHGEDGRRGDRTLSIVLGIKGTFYFCAVFFTIAAIGFFIFFETYFRAWFGLVFIGYLTPVLFYFFWWLIKVRKEKDAADFSRTMKLNFISATCLNIFFMWFFFESTQILQAVRGGF